MELSFDLYIAGLSYFADPMMFVYSLLDVFVGIVFGALPGLTATMTIAVFIPFTFGVPAVQSFAFLLGLYSGTVYGGSISAILINIPGTPSAIATGFDGYPMCRRGRAGEAIGISTISSGLGGLFSVAILVVAGTLGLIVGTVGLDPIGRYPRFVFSRPELFDGVSEIPVMIGVYGRSEMLVQISERRHVAVVAQKLKNVLPPLKEVVRLIPTIVRSSVIGVAIGAVPAAGGSIASLVAYGQEKRFSKRGDQMGTGIADGIAAPEAANNASSGGGLIPMMTLGIPGDPMTGLDSGYGRYVTGTRDDLPQYRETDAIGESTGDRDTEHAATRPRGSLVP